MFIKKIREKNKRYIKICGLKICYKDNTLDETLNKMDSIIEHHEHLLDKINEISNAHKVIFNHLNAISDHLNKHFQCSSEILHRIDFLSIALPAMQVHKQVFEKYKGIHKGKSIVLLGSAPSLNLYEPVVENAIYIGVNETILCDKLKLDYLFVQDKMSKNDLYKAANQYEGNNCKKFYGVHYSSPSGVISENDVEEANAERYFLVDREMPSNDLKGFFSDITLRPFNVWSTVAHSAFEFALWTQPKEIYLVGFDCARTGHFYEEKNEHSNSDWYKMMFDRMFYGWNYYRKFAETYYPETQIISVNPVRLKGVFDKDIYTAI